MEKKKKSKAPIIITIIILLAAAGVAYYMLVWQPQQLAQYELAQNADVETKLVAETNWHNDDMDNFREMFDAMADTDASYFFVESLGIWDEDNWSPRFRLYQTNKTEFDEKSVVNAEAAAKKVTDGMLTFFNYSYNSFPSPLYQSVNGKSIFGKLGLSDSVEGTLEPQFGGSIVKYFKSHKLKLNCSDCKVTQVGFEADEYGDAWYHYNVVANVLTEECIGDMDDLGIYANAGEAKEVRVNLVCGASDSGNGVHVVYMLIR